MNPRKRNTVLIVGGAGYIGSHTTLALNEAGFETVVYDNFSTGHRDACFGKHLVEGDLANRAKLEETMNHFDVACVVHFAALIEAGQSVITPLPFFQNNVAGTLSLLEAMECVGAKKLVFSSTAAAYGNNTDVPLLHERLPRAPINPYGDSKVMVEMILEACAEAHGLQSIALRYFNACGADPDGQTGERHDPETHPIPLVIQAAQGKRPHISVYGTDYDTPDGTCIRDYIHVSDLASGHVAAVHKLLSSDQAGFMPINLGTGSGLSVREVIDAVKQVSGIDFDVVEENRRPGDPSKIVADARVAQDVLGWRL
ncbi:UDP-glucose 4-epimerase GalE [uncultured Roseobacter sp.]|uniref:UDP-glucose 4-epimerase GalE n=1 Tax=uncultured Roseobacter sp. TaxID=114847 RepID=UPI002628B8BD|nr:UDP-glucose 4-epimerase GalE [uncultured Roseobacter sp.]